MTIRLVAFNFFERGLKKLIFMFATLSPFNKFIHALVFEEKISDLDEAEPDVVLPDILVRLAEEGRGRDSLQLTVFTQPLHKPRICFT